MSLSYRKSRIKKLSKSWNGSLVNSLMMKWRIPEDLYIQLQFAVGLYISKAMHFKFDSNEKKLVKLINKNKNNRLNITPNGGVVPKKEYQMEYNLVLKTWCDVVSSMIMPKPKLLNLFRLTPNIRIKFGNEIRENKNRKLNTAIPHSDAWVEGPFGLNCHLPIFGDTERNFLQFFKLKDEKKFKESFLNNSVTYDDMSWVLDFYKVDNKFKPKKGYIYISDYALIHNTKRTANSGLRVSIDTTINSGNHKVHKDRQAEYLKLIPSIGNDIFVKTNRSEKDIINKKKTTYSHYTTGNLERIKLR